MDVGTSYYPEDWDRARVKYDAELMEKAGLNLVRMGEFAWSHMEPREGIYDFGWLHEAVEIMSKHGISVVLCTPTATAPAWLVRKHPEILIEHPDGTKAYFGVRHHTCCTSSIYRGYCAGIAERLAREFSCVKNILAWQIDNELGHDSFGECYCEECRRGFREFLRQKYGTVSRLNTAWGTQFWSQEYSDWEEIEPGGMERKLDSTRVLDSLYFRNASRRIYMEGQLAAIRKIIPGAKVTANNISALCDRYELYSELDFSAADFYPGRSAHGLSETAYYCDLWRGAKAGTAPWMLESATSPGTPENNLLRFYLWHFLARGYEKVVYFHWRSHLSGYEKSHGTFLGFSGKPRMRYKILADAVAEMKSVTRKYPDLPRPVNEAAVILDYPSNWIYSQGFWAKWNEFEKINMEAHGALLEGGVNSDVVSAETDFAKYKLVVFPVQPHFPEKLAARVRKYTEEGGVVILCGMSGIFDGNAKYISEPGPEHLSDVFGMSIEDFIPLSSTAALTPYEPREAPASGTVSFRGILDGVETGGTAGQWIADIELKTAIPLMTFANTVLRGSPCLTENRFGRGCAIYLGAATVDRASLRRIMKHAAEISGITRPELPDSIEVIRRGPFVFVLNHGDNPADFPLGLNGRNVLGEFFSENRIRIPAREVAVIETSDQS